MPSRNNKTRSNATASSSSNVNNGSGGTLSSSLFGKRPPNPEQINFIQRSLQRNDTDIAAIIELNKSLRILQNQIIIHCGELTILDIGEGILRLSPDGVTEKFVRIRPTNNQNSTNNDNSNNNDHASKGDDTGQKDHSKKTGTNNDSSTLNHDDTVKRKVEGDDDDDDDQYLENGQKPDFKSTLLLHITTKDSETNKNKEATPVFYEPYAFEFQYQEDLCIDFCSRMKLRRRLLSRLARRLLRVATYMDGQSDIITPPPIPTNSMMMMLQTIRYNMENQSQQHVMNQYAERLKQQDAAIRTLSIQKEHDSESQFLQYVPKKGNLEQKLGNEVDDISSSSFLQNLVDTAHEQGKSDKTEEYDDGNKNMIGTDNDECTGPEDKDSDPIANPNDESRNISERDSKAANGVSLKFLKRDELATENTFASSLSSLALIDHAYIQRFYEQKRRLFDSYEALKDYEDMYEQVVDPATGKFVNYTCLQTNNNNRMEKKGPMKSSNKTPNNPKAPSGINHINYGTKHSDNNKVDDEEWKRYKESFKSRIPLQPKFADLGRDFFLFYSKNRREILRKKRLEEEQKEQHNDESIANLESLGGDDVGKKEIDKNLSKSEDFEEADHDQANLQKKGRKRPRIKGNASTPAKEIINGSGKYDHTKVDGENIIWEDERDKNEVGMKTSKHRTDEAPKVDVKMVDVAQSDNIVADEKAKLPTVVAMKTDNELHTYSEERKVDKEHDINTSDHSIEGDNVLQEFANPTPETETAERKANDESSLEQHKDCKPGIIEIGTMSEQTTTNDTLAPSNDESINKNIKEGMDLERENLTTTEVILTHVSDDIHDDKLDLQNVLNTTATNQSKIVSSPEIVNTPSIATPEQKCHGKEKNTNEKKKQQQQNEEKSHEKKEEDLDPLKLVRPISFVAIPSFYDQDLKRIRLIHEHLMTSSLRLHADRKLEECMNHYNIALSTSNDICDQRSKLQNKLHSLVAEIRDHQNAIKEYNIQVAAETHRWNKKRIHFEQTQLSHVLPSRTGNYRTGTSYIQRYMTRLDHSGISHQVGDCLADIVDTIDSIAHGLIRLEQFRETINLPPEPSSIKDSVTGETKLQKLERSAKDIRIDIEALSEKLRSSEEVRTNTWKKVLKTKAEYSISHDISTSNIPRFVQLDMNMVNSIPVPPLRQSTTQKLVPTGAISSLPGSTPTTAVRRPVNASKRVAPVGGSTLPSKIRQAQPKRSPITQNIPSSSDDVDSITLAQEPPSKSLSPSVVGSPSGTGSESKYSAARVKERIGADGTVAPVSEPKLTKEGLYVRPAGRTRKGMDWDAVRGIWIPTSNSNASNDEDD